MKILEGLIMFGFMIGFIVPIAIIETFPFLGIVSFVSWVCSLIIAGKWVFPKKEEKRE